MITKINVYFYLLKQKNSVLPVKFSLFESFFK